MANEKRLIDANVLLTSPLWDYLKEGYEKSSARTIIATQHTVDAVEVVHGRWKYYHKQNIAVCTNCSFERKLDADFGKAVSCPNCGAKMDGDGND